MLRGSSFCYICLDNDRVLMNLYRADSNKVKLLDMLTYLSFETSCIEEDIPMYICDDCHKHLRTAYDLKVKCQKNNIHVRRYIFYLKQFTHPTTFTNEPTARNSSIQNTKKNSARDELITINMDLTDLGDESDLEIIETTSQNNTVNELGSEINNTSILSKRPEFNTIYKQSQLNINKKICSVTVINQGDRKLINSVNEVLSQTRILSSRPEFNIYKNISQTIKISNKQESSSLTQENSSVNTKSSSIPVNNVISSKNKNRVVKKSSNKKPISQKTKNENPTNHNSDARPEFVEFDIISTVKLRKRGVVSVKSINNHGVNKSKVKKTTYNVKKDRKLIQGMNKCKVVLLRCQIAKNQPQNSENNTNTVEPNLIMPKDTILTTRKSVEIKEETNNLENEPSSVQDNTLLTNNSQEQSLPIPIKQEIVDDNETNITDVDLIKKAENDEFSIKIEIVDEKSRDRVAYYGTDETIKLETTAGVFKNRENTVTSTENGINSVFSFSNAEFLTTHEQITSSNENVTSAVTNKDTVEQGNCIATVGTTANGALDLTSAMSNGSCNTTESDISGELVIDEVASSKRKPITKTSSPTVLNLMPRCGKKNIFKRFLDFTSNETVLNPEQGHLPAVTVGTPAPAVAELNNDLSTVQLPNYKFPVSKRVLDFSSKEQPIDNSNQIHYEHKSLTTNVSNLNYKSNTCKTAVGKPASHLRVAQLHNEHRKVLKTIGSSATKVESLKSTIVSRKLPRKVGDPVIIGSNGAQSVQTPVNFMTKHMKLMNKYIGPPTKVDGITTKQTNNCVLNSLDCSTGEGPASIPAESNLTVTNEDSDITFAKLVHLEDCNRGILCNCTEKSHELVLPSKITIEKDVQAEHNQTSEVETSNDGALKCPTCNKQFHTKLKLKKHALIHKNFYHCPICKDKFTTKTKFKLHMLIHNECKHKCFICDTRTLTNKSLAQHYKTEHKSTKFCTKCKLIFTTDGDYVTHMERHDSKRTCTVCNRSVAQKTFRSHMKSHERSKCSLCDKYFDMKQLNEHNCTEQWEKTHKCTECDRTFYFQPSLEKHMMVHYEMQCFICKVTFGKPHAIVEHMSKHIGQNGYQCPVCNMSTFSKDNMKLHMTEHYGEITAQINTKYM